MNSALLTGLSGLRANQDAIDVVGNNLANANTVGFKSTRASFADVFNQTLRGASGPTGSLGGINPMQLGHGVQVSSVDQNFNQGALLTTNRTFDLAVNGTGLFALGNGSETYYTRVGTFDFDRNDTLVDTRTGYFVRSATGSTIVVDRDQVSAPKATTGVTLAGNLPADATGPRAEVIETGAPLQSEQPAVITGTPAANPTVLASATSLQILVGGNATPVTVSFAAGSYTPADIASAIQSALTSAGAAATATESGGVITLSTTDRGENASINITDGTPGAAAALGFTPGTETGSASAATGATLINDLSTTTTAYASGDRIRIQGTLSNGAAVSSLFTVDGTSDVDDLLAAIESTFAGEVDAEVTSDGTIRLTATEAGASSLSLALEDVSGNVGAGAYASNAFETTIDGTEPEIVETFINVFDSQGVAHNLSLAFERQADGTWNVSATLPPEDGTVLSGTVTGLTFAPDGTLTGPMSSEISVQFTGFASPQTVTLGFQDSSDGSGITQYGGSATAEAVAQDGYAAGNLQSLSVRSDGVIEGIFSNGQTRELDRIGLVNFRNPEGLERVGSSLFRLTGNSGDAVLTEAGSGQAGVIVSGALEGSNVDIAEEFIRLIEAQRSFQASARVVSTSSDVLADLVSIR